MLKEKIEAELKDALIKKNERVVSTLRLLKAVILNKEKEKRYALSKQHPEKSPQMLEKESVLTDEEIIANIFTEIKKRKESISFFRQGKREDLAKKEEEEIAVLESYLPPQMSEEELRKLAKESIEQAGAKNIKDMGKVMALLVQKTKGKAQGSIVSQIVKELLS